MLKVESISVQTKRKEIILKKLSIELNVGEAVGLTGQSGSGKTTLVKAIMGFLNRGCVQYEGEIWVDDIELNSLSGRKRRLLCGTTIGFIPQSPMTAFDSRIVIGKQMIETFSVRLGLKNKIASDLAMKTLIMVGLSDTKRIMRSLPFQLSGGMLQRVAVALLIGLRPKYILADEPTSALDEDNRDLLLELFQTQLKETGLLLISHDVATLSSLCQNILVLSKGQIIESGSMEKLLHEPRQKWTKEFAASHAGRNGGMWDWKEF